MRLLAYQEEAGISLEEQLDGRFDLGRLRELYFERLGPNESMIRYVTQLRARGLRTALLTNNVREWEPLWRGKLPQLDRILALGIGAR
jgi:putative hydrolase of the HAD superfamily